VWSAAVDRRPDQLAWLDRLLAPEERARAGRFRFARDGTRFAARRAIRRWVLAGYLGTDPASLAFAAGPHGKPALAGERELTFSDSESGGLALIAVATRARVGVDLERVRPLPGATRVMERLGTPADRAAFESLRPEDRERGFFRWWTAKEALVKALGTGLDDSLAGVDLASGWCRTELPMGPDHIGCLVTEGQGAAVTRMTVDDALQARSAS
jgi:4'-phosphopantetheinyl transferase